MDDKGNIREFSKEDADEMYKKRLIEAQGRMRHEWTPLTDDEARYFKSKGIAMRELWGKRLSRGLTVEQRDQLNQLVTEFLASESAPKDKQDG
jgi:hypothetical protein